MSGTDVALGLILLFFAIMMYYLFKSDTKYVYSKKKRKR